MARPVSTAASPAAPCAAAADGLTLLTVGEGPWPRQPGPGNAGRTVLVHAGAGREALAALGPRRVDVVLSDQRLPDMTGLRFLTEARDAGSDLLPVLAMAADMVDTELARAAQDPGAGFRLLVKPLGEGSLDALLDEAERLRLCRRARAVGSEQPPATAAAGPLQQALSVAPSGFLELDLDGRVTRTNPLAETLLQTPAAKLQGRMAGDLGVPCRLPRAPNPRAERSFCSNREIRSLVVGADMRTFLWSCQAVRDEDGGFCGCTVSFMDATGRSDLDLKIFQAKHELEAIFDSVTDPTFLVDADLRVRRANRAFSQYARKPFREIINHRCSAVMGEAAASCDTCHLPEVFATGSPHQDEVRTADGSIRKMYFFPLLGDGQVKRVVVRSQDVTAERQLEEQLLQSERMASIGQLSAGIAHEINNPMGFISWNLSQLGKYLADLDAALLQTRTRAQQVAAGELDATQAWEQIRAEWEEAEVEFLVADSREVVADCRDGCERVQKIIGNLKSFSHPATGDWAVADLHAGIEDTIAIVWNELKHRCELVRAYGDLPPVRCHIQKLNQVFMNLLVNAAQAMDTRGTLTVRTGAAGDHVWVEVEDTGRGIAAQNLKRIFDPFFTTKPVGKGTGLGLHLALGIVREHSGELTVHSTPGVGTRFKVTLPVAPPVTAAPTSAQPAAPGGTE